MKGKITGGVNRTVWCSAGWNYEYTALKLDKLYPAMLLDGPLVWETKSVDTGDTSTAKGE